jgi:hypothetical protein
MAVRFISEPFPICDRSRSGRPWFARSSPRPASRVFRRHGGRLTGRRTGDARRADAPGQFRRTAARAPGSGTAAAQTPSPPRPAGWRSRARGTHESGGDALPLTFVRGRPTKFAARTNDFCRKNAASFNEICRRFAARFNEVSRTVQRWTNDLCRRYAANSNEVCRRFAAALPQASTKFPARINDGPTIYAARMPQAPTMRQRRLPQASRTVPRGADDTVFFPLAVGSLGGRRGVRTFSARRAVGRPWPDRLPLCSGAARRAALDRAGERPPLHRGSIL